MFFYDEQTTNCVLNTETAKTQPDLFTEIFDEAVDYFELNCALQQRLRAFMSRRGAFRKKELKMKAKIADSPIKETNILRNSGIWSEWTPCDKNSALKTRFRNCDGSGVPNRCHRVLNTFILHFRSFFVQERKPCSLKGVQTAQRTHIRRMQEAEAEFKNRRHAASFVTASLQVWFSRNAEICCTLKRRRAQRIKEATQELERLRINAIRAQELESRRLTLLAEQERRQLTATTTTTERPTVPTSRKDFRDVYWNINIFQPPLRLPLQSQRSVLLEKTTERRL